MLYILDTTSNTHSKTYILQILSASSHDVVILTYQRLRAYILLFFLKHGDL